ncbi:MAG: hypothetical protein ACM3ML_02225 [Micromonosporaceae bacterium]
MSLATAKTHLGHLLTKLDARDRIQLVILAYRTGLVSADVQDNQRNQRSLSARSRDQRTAEAGGGG